MKVPVAIAEGQIYFVADKLDNLPLLDKLWLEQFSEGKISFVIIFFASQTKSWDWLKCKPTIKGCFTSPGVLEVFWEPPVEGVQKEIKAYQVKFF